MDVSTIKPPAEKPAGEQNSNTPQGSDPAFLQLLASLGLISLNPVDPGHSSTVNGETSAHIESLSIDQGVSAGGSAATAVQEKVTAAGQANQANVLLAQAISAAHVGTAAEDLLAHVTTSVGKNESALTATASAQPLTAGAKDAPVTGQAVTADGKPSSAVTPLADVKGATQSIPQATIPKDEQAALSRLMDVVSSGHGPKERGSALTVTPTSIGLTLNAVIQPSTSSETPLKQTSTMTQTLAWGAVLEPSDLSEFGQESNSPSAEHDGWKERFPRTEAGGSQPTSAPATSPLSVQSASMPARSAVPAAVEAPPVTAPLESPLPASVRFEVQPGDMGRIRVHLSVVDHTVYTNVMTERAEAHDFLLKSSERYEAGLAAHGLDVGRFQVDVQAQGREHADRGGTAWSQEQTHRPGAEPPSHVVTEQHSDEGALDWEDRMVNLFA